MCQECFTGVKACAGVVTGCVVQNIKQGLLVWIAGQPGVGAGVVLPEGAQIAGLPAFDRFGRGFVAGVWGELVLDGPAADAGAVGFKMETAVEFAGTSAVGRCGFGRQEFGEQLCDLSRPVRMVIAAGTSRRPSFSVAIGASFQVIGIQFIITCVRQSQFVGGSLSGELAGAMAG